jgi:hypothetical protein
MCSTEALIGSGAALLDVVDTRAVAEGELGQLALGQISGQTESGELSTERTTMLGDCFRLPGHVLHASKRLRLVSSAQRSGWWQWVWQTYAQGDPQPASAGLVIAMAPGARGECA